jgi:hypothetical protein
MPEIDYLTPFYSQHHDRDGLIRGIDSLLSSEDVCVRAIPFGCKEPVGNWLTKLGTENRQIEHLYSRDGVHAFQADYACKDAGNTISGKGNFFIIAHPDYADAFVALSVEGGFFFHRVLHPLIQSAHPRLVMTFITHKRLRNVLEAFKAAGDFSELQIVRASQRLRFQDSYSHKHVMPVISWPDTPLAEAFDWVYQNNGWFQSLEFEARRGGRTMATVSVSRQGIIKTNSLFVRVFEQLIDPVCKTIHENFLLFAHRSRLDSLDFGTKPLAIDFAGDQFAAISENKKFIEAMRRLNTASVSVLHGNPYIHLSVIDYYDGSTFDLWVLSANRLVLVPQMKASIGAIKRIVSHIFDNYAEGHIGNFEGMAA